MEIIDYDEARIEGGIEAFKGATKPDRSKAAVGEIIIKIVQADEFSAGIIEEDEEDLLEGAA